MAGINSLKGLRNVNLTSVKEGVKRSAALTLLLSTVACSQYDINNYNCILALPGILIPLIGFIRHLMIVNGKSSNTANKREAESHDHWSSYGGGRNGPDQ